ncbi:MAG: hypothetical protein NVSMB52_06280 [Chloroflexota bacterium]
MGFARQPAFLNIALEGETTLLPQELLKTVKDIEETLGRVPSSRWGPRLIDIDILLYGDLILETATLTIPHREMLNRKFVLLPLAEIAPHLRHPIANREVSALCGSFPSGQKVTLIGGFPR